MFMPSLLLLAWKVELKRPLTQKRKSDDYRFIWKVLGCLEVKYMEFRNVLIWNGVLIKDA